jgi:N-acetylglucosaminyldiphosphoundecaprenol N-acetyl-beta-D-mannosaminyltransferase
MSRIKFLNTYIDSLTVSEAKQRLDKLVQDKKPQYVVTPNTDIVMRMQKEPDLLDICNNADLILTDGEMVVKLSKFLGNPIKERVAMTDFVWNVCDLALETGYRMFLFGGKASVLEKGKMRIQQKYPLLNICGHYSPPLGFENNPTELQKALNIIRESKADILIVFLGCPKQERFIAKYKDEYQVPVSITMGGCIDFIGTDIKRAPLWMQKSGLEWFFRFAQEPKRLFKRYFIDDVKIFPLVLKYKLGIKKS